MGDQEMPATPSADLKDLLREQPVDAAPATGKVKFADRLKSLSEQREGPNRTHSILSMRGEARSKPVPEVVAGASLDNMPKEALATPAPVRAQSRDAFATPAPWTMSRSDSADGGDGGVRDGCGADASVGPADPVTARKQRMTHLQSKFADRKDQGKIHRVDPNFQVDPAV